MIHQLKTIMVLYVSDHGIDLRGVQIFVSRAELVENVRVMLV